MTDPAQDSAARGALQAAAEESGRTVSDLFVREVVRLRRRGTKIPFYWVTIEERETGSQMRFQVSDNGTRVERDRYDRSLTPPPGSRSRRA